MMTETPREYKKRIDEKRARNEKNKGKLLEKIEWYDLLDSKFKAKTKQEIVENFLKNEKADKESEQYKIIVSELENVDKKYEKLEELKQTLESKEKEIDEVNKEIKESKLDWTDETTLIMQMARTKELTERLKTLKSEVEELRKEISNREQEIEEIEATYGEMDQIDDSEKELTSDVKDENNSSDETLGSKKTTLKEFGETTIKDLRKKDRTRSEIIKLLEEWTWIDEELKQKIEWEILSRFSEYYGEKQWSLRMKSARFLKNKLRNSEKRYVEIAEMPDWEKESKITEIERREKMYFGKEWDLRKLVTWRELSKKIGYEIVDYKEIQYIWWKPAFRAKNSDWYYAVYRWDSRCCGRYREIWKIQDIWWKPAFRITDGSRNNYYSVYRWDIRCCTQCREIWEIQNIWWKPVFKARNSDWYYAVYRWDSRLCYRSREIWEIQDIWWNPAYRVKDSDWYYSVHRWDSRCWDKYGREIWEIQNIWWKPAFKVIDCNERETVFRWGRRCNRYYEKIREIKNVRWKPSFNIGGKWKRRSAW